MLKIFNLDNESHRYIFDNLINKIKAHKLKSGEIILLFETIQDNNTHTNDIITYFLLSNSIKTEPRTFEVVEITSQQAISSIKYGLSTKSDYTSIEVEFSDSDQNFIVYTFLGLFDKPKFYSIDARLYRTDLDVNDFWESGGAIVVDSKSIGILWANDLYNMFR